MGKADRMGAMTTSGSGGKGAPSARPVVTLRDVASKAGVSVATVSLVVNEKTQSRVSEATQQRVLQAVNELGYRTNALAKSLVRGESAFIGIVSDAIATTPFAGKIIRGAQEEARRHGYVLLVADTDADPDATQQAIQMMIDHRALGVLYSTWYHREVDAPAALEGVPSVFVNCLASEPGSCSIIPDEVRGGETATSLLVGRGHQRIAFINSTEDAPSTVGRLEGYRLALRSAGIEPDERLVFTAVPEQEGGYDAAAAMLALSDRPTAVFCYNDRVAMGLYDRVKEEGLRIPDDLAVVGFDDQEVIAAHLRPTLSSVALPHYDIGVLGVRALLARVAGDRTEAVQRVFCPPVLRDSF